MGNMRNTPLAPCTFSAKIQSGNLIPRYYHGVVQKSGTFAHMHLERVNLELHTTLCFEFG